MFRNQVQQVQDELCSDRGNVAGHCRVLELGLFLIHKLLML